MERVEWGWVTTRGRRLRVASTAEAAAPGLLQRRQPGGVASEEGEGRERWGGVPDPTPPPPPPLLPLFSTREEEQLDL